LVAGLPLICTERAEHQGICLWAGPTSMIASPSMQSIQTSCSRALPVNLDSWGSVARNSSDALSSTDFSLNCRDATVKPMIVASSYDKGSAITSKTDPYGSLRGNRTPSFGIRILLNLSISRSLMPTLFVGQSHRESSRSTCHIATYEPANSHLPTYSTIYHVQLQTQHYRKYRTVSKSSRSNISIQIPAVTAQSIVER
jgi:hypothetical protein